MKPTETYVCVVEMVTALGGVWVTAIDAGCVVAIGTIGRDVWGWEIYAIAFSVGCVSVDAGSMSASEEFVIVND